MKNGSVASFAFDGVRLDQIDRKIIGELVADGRLSMAELGRRVNLSPPATSERLQRLVDVGIITGFCAVIDPRALGYQLSAIIRVKPAPGQLKRIPALAQQIPEVAECHRITGEDCFYIRLHLQSIDDLAAVLDRFLAYGETTTSIINASPITHRVPPVPASI
jgi:Lrp/AsnC family transcriptional regulator, leucine-responsive regulatory protein